MSAVSEGLVIKLAGSLLSLTVAVLAWLLTGVLADVKQLSENMIRLMEWREQITTQNTIPRSELELREKLFAAQLEQMRLRIDGLEKRQ